jgi:hypothetical protein
MIVPPLVPHQVCNKIEFNTTDVNEAKGEERLTLAVAANIMPPTVVRLTWEREKGKRNCSLIERVWLMIKYIL